MYKDKYVKKELQCHQLHHHVLNTSANQTWQGGIEQWSDSDQESRSTWDGTTPIKDVTKSLHYSLHYQLCYCRTLTVDHD